VPIPYNCPHCGTHFEVAEQYAGQTGPCASCGRTITAPAAPPPAVAATPRTGGVGAVLAVFGILLLSVVCLAGLIAALVAPVYHSAQAPTPVSATNANLQIIGAALHAYHTHYDQFPPAYLADEQDQPMHSWRVLLLPYLNYHELYKAYDFSEPWNGPNNSLLQSRMPPVYASGQPSGLPVAMPVGTTRYAVISGTAAAFDGPNTVKMDDFSDGLPTTILVAEAGSPVNWMAPVDIDYASMGFVVNGPIPANGNAIGSDAGNGAFVLTADGQVHFLPADLFEEAVKALVTRAGNEAVALD